MTSTIEEKASFDQQAQFVDQGGPYKSQNPKMKVAFQTLLFSTKYYQEILMLMWFI